MNFAFGRSSTHSLDLSLTTLRLKVQFSEADCFKQIVLKSLRTNIKKVTVGTDLKSVSVVLWQG